MRALVALAAALGLAGCSVISLDLTPRLRPLEEHTVEGRGADKILLMDISGLITDEAGSGGLSIGTPPPRVPLLVRVREELQKAGKDSAVRGLVVKINSPGGTVTASDIVFRELTLHREETRVPMVAVLMDVAASGGYYVALAADRIVAHPTSVTGSIGVIMLTLNAQGLLEKVGVAATAIKSGERKDMGSPFRSMTPEERAIFQSVIDDLQGQFVTRVIERRKLSPEAVRPLADGRIFTAQQALATGLVDQVGYIPDALAAARRLAGVDEARVIVYRRPREYRATYYAGTRAETGALDGALGPLAALLGPGPRLLYLWWP